MHENPSILSRVFRSGDTEGKTDITEEIVAFRNFTNASKQHIIFHQTMVPCGFNKMVATAHTAVISIAALRRLFPQRVISRYGDVTWPPRSPDLSAPYFFLWGNLKSKVYGNRPTDLTCTQRKHTGRNHQTFRKNHFKPLRAAS